MLFNKVKFLELFFVKLEKFYCIYLIWIKLNEYLYWKINEKKFWWMEREENIFGYDYKNVKLDLFF